MTSSPAQYLAAHAAIADTAKNHGVSTMKILSSANSKFVNAARREAMARVVAIGFGIAETGRFMGRDHRTVCAALGRFNRRVRKI